jgi:hypothetical protein
MNTHRMQQTHYVLLIELHSQRQRQSHVQISGHHAITASNTISCFYLHVSQLHHKFYRKTQDSH